MARRKISIEDALKVLEEAGIPLQPKPLETVVAVERKRVSPAFEKPATLPDLVKVTLFAKHSVGSGGVTKQTVDGKQIENAGVQTYGPGVCTVSAALASHLLHADAAAKAADERMLSREQRSFLIVRKVGPGGTVANVGVQVSQSVFDGSGGELPQEFMHMIG